MTELSIERIDVFQVDLPYSGGVYKLSGGGSTGASMRRLSGCNAVAPCWVDTDLNIDFGESMPDPEGFRRSIGRGIFCDRTGLDD